MCTVFWDRRGILLVDFLTRSETVNAKRYCETLQKLRRAIQNKWRGMLNACVVLLRYNARPLTARCSTHLLQELSWEVFNHAPHSQWFPPFLTHQKVPVLSELAFSEWQGGGDECHALVPISGGRLTRHRVIKVGPMVWQISQFRRWICWKIAQHLLSLFQ